MTQSYLLIFRLLVLTVINDVIIRAKIIAKMAIKCAFFVIVAISSYVCISMDYMLLVFD